MRSSQLFRGGALAARANPRREADRRRWIIVAAMLGLALASGVTASIADRSGAATTGPFSYFPHE